MKDNGNAGSAQSEDSPSVCSSWGSIWPFPSITAGSQLLLGTTCSAARELEIYWHEASPSWCWFASLKYHWYSQSCVEESHPLGISFLPLTLWPVWAFHMEVGNASELGVRATVLWLEGIFHSSVRKTATSHTVGTYSALTKPTTCLAQFLQ